MSNTAGQMTRNEPGPGVRGSWGRSSLVITCERCSKVFVFGAADIPRDCPVCKRFEQRQASTEQLEVAFG